jgi:hypothetical protein
MTDEEIENFDLREVVDLRLVIAMTCWHMGIVVSTESKFVWEISDSFAFSGNIAEF